eukprot:324814_1
MNPYVFNPYAIAAATNIAHYNATAVANGQSNGSTIPGPPSNPTNLNPYAAAAAAMANPALAQAAALNAYTRNIAAVQQQINGIVALNGLNPINPEMGMETEIAENEEEDTENGTKNKKK